MTKNPRIRIYANRWFAKFAAKEMISDATLADAVHRAESGLIDADLGGGLIKQRIARQGGGKSGGYRSILIFRSGERAIFVFAFAKSDKANLSKAELKVYRKAARLTNFNKTKTFKCSNYGSTGDMRQLRHGPGR